MVKSIISDAVNESVFGFLCVLDGVRSIFDTGDSNNLKLTHGDTLLNDIENECLHDLYKTYNKLLNKNKKQLVSLRSTF